MSPRSSAARATPKVRAPRPTVILSQFADRLARAGDLSLALEDALETLRAGLNARGCALWLRREEQWSLAIAVGESTPQPVSAADRQSNGRPFGLDPTSTSSRDALARISSGTASVGAIVVGGVRPLSPERRGLLRTVADLLAPLLVSAEHARRLTAEVAQQAQENESQRRFFEKIVDSLPVGLYVIDREYRIQAWNRKRETGTLGVSREEAIGRSIFEILHRQPADLLLREFEDVFASGDIRQFHMESSAFGEPRTYRVTKIPMTMDSSRRVTHVITIGEDMTPWKMAQERIAQAEKLAAVGQLAAGVMHEINNPLATIGACGESMTLALDDPGVDPRFRDSFDDYLKIVDHEVHRCKRIIDGLLHFSRPQSSIRTACDITLVLGETLFLLKHHARFKKMRVETEFESDPAAAVHGNPEQLIQVFMALLLNATDAMNGSGRIRLRSISGGSPAEQVVVEICDEGHGIPRGELGRIFDPFYTTKPPGRGTGLGLSICYGIIADHGGRIEVESVTRQGSTFRVILPAAESR